MAGPKIYKCCKSPGILGTPLKTILRSCNSDTDRNTTHPNVLFLNLSGIAFQSLIPLVLEFGGRYGLSLFIMHILSETKSDCTSRDCSVIASKLQYPEAVAIRNLPALNRALEQTPDTRHGHEYPNASSPPQQQQGENQQPRHHDQPVRQKHSPSTIAFGVEPFHPAYPYTILWRTT